MNEAKPQETRPNPLSLQGNAKMACCKPFDIIVNGDLNAMVDQVGKQIRAIKGTFEGNTKSGMFSAYRSFTTIEGNYVVGGNVVTVTITKLKGVGTCSMVESVIRGYFKPSPAAAATAANSAFSSSASTTSSPSAGELSGRIILGFFTSIPHGILGFFVGGFTGFAWAELWMLAIKPMGYESDASFRNNMLGTAGAIAALGLVLIGFISGIVRSVFETHYWKSIGVLFLGPFVPPFVAGLFCVCSLLIRRLTYIVASLSGYEVLGTAEQWAAVGAIIGLFFSAAFVVVGPIQSAAEATG